MKNDVSVLYCIVSSLHGGCTNGGSCTNTMMIHGVHDCSYMLLLSPFHYRVAERGRIRALGLPMGTQDLDAF